MRLIRRAVANSNACPRTAASASWQHSNHVIVGISPTLRTISILSIHNISQIAVKTSPGKFLKMIIKMKKDYKSSLVKI